MRLRHLLQTVGLAAAVFLIVHSSAAADEPPAPPSPQVVEIDRTVDGLNVDEWAAQSHRWHRAAARYRHSLIAMSHTTPPWGANWLEGAFLCIHSFEGRWTDPNAPYWGGIQMDVSFMRSYMPWAYRQWGTADHWPVAVQIAAGIHAWISRGFYPWPNTARYCGLIR